MVSSFYALLRHCTSTIFPYTTLFRSYGNNDPRVDDIAVNLVKSFMNKIEQNETYRDSVPTQSVLTITSNVVYRSEEHTSELQSRGHLVCRLLLEKKNQQKSPPLVELQ